MIARRQWRKGNLAGSLVGWLVSFRSFVRSYVRCFVGWSFDARYAFICSMVVNDEYVNKVWKIT